MTYQVPLNVSRETRGDVRRRWVVWIVALVVVMAGTGLVLRFALTRSGLVGSADSGGVAGVAGSGDAFRALSRHLGVVVDRWFEAPDQSRAVRLILTDQGSFGYGSAALYQYSPSVGYTLVWSHPSVVALGTGAEWSVVWSVSSIVCVQVTDPQRGLVGATVAIDVAEK